MFCRSNMLDIDTELRPQAAVYLLLFMPIRCRFIHCNTSVHHLSSHRIADDLEGVGGEGGAFCKGRLAAGSPTRFSLLGTEQLVQTVAEWNQLGDVGYATALALQVKSTSPPMQGT